MNRLCMIALFLAATPLIAQTIKQPEANQVIPPVASTSTPQPSPKTNVPAQVKTETQTPQETEKGPNGIVLKPAPIVYGESNIPGDSEVLAILGDINNISGQYNKDLANLNNQYKPLWDVQEAKMQDAIHKVKIANKWGDDVIFNGATRQWVKLTPSEVEAMEKAIKQQAASKTTQKSSK